MHTAASHNIYGQQLWLSPDRGMYWEDQQALIVSDLHFGKTGHFRKSGIGVPANVYKEDLHRLICQVQYFQPKQLIVVGDLFHSRMNLELELFKKWRDDFAQLEIRLVKGNHDILHEGWYSSAGITVSDKRWFKNQFHFIHDIADSASMSSSEQDYFFSGHIHPAVRLHGAGKQSVCLPCFYFGERFAVLPAFSRFTGTAVIEPKKHEHVFAIVKQSIVQLQ